MNLSRRLAISLLCLRLSIFITMLMWTFNKFIRPADVTGIFAHFYHLPLASHWAVYAIAGLELIVLLAFVIGYHRRLSYAAVFVLHAVSTIASYRQYLAPFHGVNLLFFAALPMLAACFTLYLLREQDELWVVKPSGPISKENPS
ncbi:MAG: DoxX family membrane protein [Terriglobia bacterium]